tara:strand:- start:233 stop:670 length:438 start_codon:yes stop_codon:yes gene_type:complete
MKTFRQFNEGLKDYSNQGKNVRVPGEDTASFGKLFKDDLKQMGKFKNPKTGKLEGSIFPDPRKGYQLRQFATGRGGITRTLNPFLGKGQGLRSGPTPLSRQSGRLLRQGAKAVGKTLMKNKKFALGALAVGGAVKGIQALRGKNK